MKLFWMFVDLALGTLELVTCCFAVGCLPLVVCCDLVLKVWDYKSIAMD
jgi:hypothetical protein